MDGSYDREKHLERQMRAFHWVRILAELPGRLAGSAAEREAAERVAAWIRELGVDEVAPMPVPSRPRLGWTLGLHLGLGALGCWLGGGLGALLTVLVVLSFRRELRGGPLLLSRWFPAPSSWNVVGRAGSRTATQRVVLSAHIDGPQAGWVFSEAVVELFTGWARRRGAGDRAPPGPLTLPHALLLAGTFLALAAWLGADGFWLNTARFLVGSALAVGCAAALEWAWARPSPGANDNASGVAAMLTCAEQLLSQLPEEAELWVVGTGAEETGCCGMRAFCDAHPDWSVETTYFVNFECVGGAALHYVRSEASLDRTTYPPLLVELARRIAASGVFGAVTPTQLPAFTDGQIPARRCFPTLSLVSLEPGGAPRGYHRGDDLPETLDMATLVRSADFAAAVARAALRGEAGPLAIV